MQLLETLITQLKKQPNFFDDSGELKKWVVLTKAQNLDAELIELLLENSYLKEKFFLKIKDSFVFNLPLFSEFLEQKNYLNDSYTAYKQTIGLNIDGKYLHQRNEVALVWPFKDCLLEGGQSTEEQKREEVFFNQILAQDEITKLKEPKVFSNAQKYTANGEQQFNGFKRNQAGQITDNLIIKGNNLLALYSLKQQFAGKVKLIYIDPPYNTGNDGFKYNDNFNHSTWLTFMKNRLEVAKELLKDDGVIFVQIDDNEQAYLKVLMDEVFGRENFLGTVVWQQFHTTKNDAKNFSKNIEYILSYAKTLNNKTILNNQSFDKSDSYRYNDNDGRGFYKLDPITAKSGNKKTLIEKYIFENGVEYSLPSGTFWRYSFQNLKELEKENKIYFNSKNTPMYKRYLNEVQEGKKNSTLWLGSEVGFNIHGDKEIKYLFLGNKIFKNPKPESLVERVIQIATQPSDIVLDFHLGSGTTAAVAHKMGRQYIGIEQMSYIQTIAVARLKKVIGKSTKHTITNQEKTQLQQILYKLQNNHKLI